MVFFNSIPRIIEHYQPDSKATIDATELKPFFSKLNKEEELGDGEMPGASGTTKVLIPSHKRLGKQNVSLLTFFEIPVLLFF